MSPAAKSRLAALDHAHVWHPFTPMQTWRQSPPLIIERGEGDFLIDTEGRRYLDGVSSLWCNVHGHRVPHIDQAVRDQLDKIAHTTLLGLASPPSIELAARLVEIVNTGLKPRAERSQAPDAPVRASSPTPQAPGLNKVFYSDAGATALEVAFKMAVGYWHHRGRPEKRRFIGLAGAYHGDTTGAMSVGFSELFHKPFLSMVFDVTTFPNVDAARCPRIEAAGVWPSEDAEMNHRLMQDSLRHLRRLLDRHGDETAAIVIEPVMQGAAGMICQPPGFVGEVARLAREHDVLLIADEVATGFARTGRMFAVEHDAVSPDVLCLAKGLSGGYLPLAATLTTDEVERAFRGQPHEHKTLYHGHTYTGNALACAAALASLDLFDQLVPASHAEPSPQHREGPDPSPDLLTHVQRSAAIIARRLDALRDHPHVLDVRQRGIMVGIELCRSRRGPVPLDPARRTAAAVCHALRDRGVIIRPLGDVLILMPIPAMRHDHLETLLDAVVHTLREWKFEA